MHKLLIKGSAYEILNDLSTINSLEVEIMILQDIIVMVKNLNIKIDAIAIILTAIVCYLSYIKIKENKILEEEKDLWKRKMIIIFIAISYTIIIFDITLLNRGAYRDNNINFNLFTSYKMVLNTFDKSVLRHIILNILMTIPLGILLPFIHNKFHKIRWTMTVGIIFVLAIELIQLTTNSGIFDVDDILNNSIGVLIGYCISMLVLSIKKKSNKNEPPKVLRYMIPILAIASIFLSLFIYGNTKGYGMMTIAGYIKANNKNIDIDMELRDDFSSEEKIVPIYRVQHLSKDETKKIAESFFENINNDSIDLEEDLYDKFAQYELKMEDNKMLLLIKYLGGRYEYTNLSKPIANENTNVDEGLLKEQLSYFNIKIPENSVFREEDDNTYIWKIDKYTYEDSLIDGQLICMSSDDGTIAIIRNDIITYSKEKDVSIISEREAYEKLLEGDAWIFYVNEENKFTEALDIYIDYKLDSKGFFRPVYVFICKGDGEEFEIIVDALK